MIDKRKKKNLRILFLIMLILISSFPSLTRAEKNSNIIDKNLVNNVKLVENDEGKGKGKGKDKDKETTYDITRHILDNRGYLFLNKGKESKIKINLIREHSSNIDGYYGEASRLINSKNIDDFKLMLQDKLAYDDIILDPRIKIKYYNGMDIIIHLLDETEQIQVSNRERLANIGNQEKPGNQEKKIIKDEWDILMSPVEQKLDSDDKDVRLKLEQDYTRNVEDYPLDTFYYYIEKGKHNTIIKYDFMKKNIYENNLKGASVEHKVKLAGQEYPDDPRLLYVKGDNRIIEGETIIRLPKKSYPTSINVRLENSNKTGKTKQEDLSFSGEYSLDMIKRGTDEKVIKSIELDKSKLENKSEELEINIDKELYLEDDEGKNFYDWIEEGAVELRLRNKTESFSIYNAGVDQKAKVKFYYYNEPYVLERTETTSGDENPDMVFEGEPCAEIEDKVEIYNQVTTTIKVHKIYLERENLLGHNQKTEKDKDGNIYIENKDGKYGYLDDKGKLNKEKAKEIGLEGDSSNKEDNYFGKHDKLEGVLFRLEDQKGKILAEKRTNEKGEAIFTLDNSEHPSKVRIVEVREESNDDYYTRVRTGEKIKRNLVGRADDLEITHPIYNDDPDGINPVEKIDLYPKNTLDESLIRKRLMDKNPEGEYSYRSDNNYDMGENIYWSLEALIPRGFNLNWAQIIDRPGNGLMIEEIEKVMVNGKVLDKSFYSRDEKSPAEDAEEGFTDNKDLVLTLNKDGINYINKLNKWEKPSEKTSEDPGKAEEGPEEDKPEDPYKDYSKIQLIVRGKIKGDKYLNEDLELVNRAIYNYKFSKYKEENQSTRVDNSLVKTGKAQLIKTNVMGEKLEGGYFYLYKEVFNKEGKKTIAYLRYSRENQIGKIDWIEKIDEKNKPSQLISDSSGNIYIEGKVELKGIKDGSYYLEEIKAPEGYNKLANPKRVVFSKELRDQEQKIINTKYFMPETGGQGLMKRLGLALMVIGLATYLLYKRNKKKIDKLNKEDR